MSALIWKLHVLILKTFCLISEVSSLTENDGIFDERLSIMIQNQVGIEHIACFWRSFERIYYLLLSLFHFLQEMCSSVQLVCLLPLFKSRASSF